MSIESEIGKPDNRDTVIVRNADNKDIIRVLESQFAKAVREAAPIAYRFKGKDRMETARNIYTSLKNDVIYEKDGFGYQDIRLPRRFWNTRKGDCKSFTLNTLAIWSNLYPDDDVIFKYAGYYDENPPPTHVYGLVGKKGEKPIIIDGCWPFFNSEKTPSFTQRSNPMDVRILSGVGDCGIQFTPEAKAMYNRVYSSLTSQREKEAFKEFLYKKMMLELNKEEYVNGTITPECMYDNICAIEGIGRASAAKKAKRKAKAKKFLHWFNAAALFLGRAAFLLFVTLNVNGLASKLADLHKWGKDTGVMNTWYMFGGNTKKFLQIIERGAKKKKLFLSKKAKEKYEQRYGPLSPNEVTYEQGTKVSGIGVLPALAAAALAVVPILAGIIPKMIDGFRAGAKAGIPGASKQAGGLIGEGTDLVNANMANGYNPATGDLVNSFLPPGQSAMSHSKVDSRAIEPNKGGIVWDLKKFYTPIADPTAPDDTVGVELPPDANTVIPAGSPDGTVSIPPDAPNIPDEHAADMAQLAPLLKTLAATGLATAGSVMSQSQNPNIRKWGGALDGAESALTGQALHKAGYHEDAKFHEGLHAGTRINMVGVAFWGGLAYLALSGGDKKKISGVGDFAKEHPWMTFFTVGAAIAVVGDAIHKPIVVNTSNQLPAEMQMPQLQTPEINL
jgi:hypothetical protein